MAPWLSILIPVYNVEDYLLECLASVLLQADTGVEIIVVDDKSTDGSLALLEMFASEQQERIKILQHPFNKGLSSARNTLIDAAKGEYLWFLDSDDALVPNAISELNIIRAQYSPDLIMCDYKVWRPDAENKNVKENHVSSFGGVPGVLLDDGELLFKELYRSGKLHAWSKISKRYLWDETLRFPEGKYFEDMVTTPRLALKVKNFYYQNRVWVHYRQRPGSILSVPSLKKIEDMSSGASQVLDIWLQKYPAMEHSTRFLFVCFCMKIYRFTIIELIKINQLNPAMLAIYRQRFYENIKLNKAELIKQHLLYGSMFKLLKLLRFL